METTTGFVHVRPPSVERFTMAVFTLSTVSEKPNHTLCFGSYATEGSLTRRYGPGGSDSAVMPGMNPWCHVAPASVDVAHPMSSDPPSVYRPVWNTETMVDPNPNVSGSTSV